MPHANAKWLRRLPGRLRRDRDGASLLEFTVVLPFLIAFGFGVLEFGNALYQYHMVTTGVRDAGRYLGSMDKDGVDAVENAKRIAVCGEVREEACEDEGHKRVPWWPADIADIEDALEVKYCINGVEEGDAIDGCDCEDPPALNPDPGFGSSKVCVRTIAEYDDVGFLGSLGLGPITFTIGHEQRYYGIR
jgi:hypothetical protein